jgi:hypothetical protein
MCKCDDVIMNAENYSKDELENKIFIEVIKHFPSPRGEGKCMRLNNRKLRMIIDN